MKTGTNQRITLSIVWFAIFCVLFLFPLLSIAQDATVLIFDDDSRRDPVCYADWMAQKAMAVAEISHSLQGPAFCTAFLISPKNHILTAAHCIDEDSEFWDLGSLTLRFGTQAEQCNEDFVYLGPSVEIRAVDKIEMNRELDYILFQLPYQDDPEIHGEDVAVQVGWLELDPDTRLTKLDESDKGLYIIAQNSEFGKIMLSQDDDCKITDEKADCWVEDLDLEEDACFEHHCDGQQGNSGGPVLLNTNGKVVGVMNSYQEGFLDLGYWFRAVKIKRIYPEIRDFLPTTEDLADNDNDGIVNCRDNCPDVANTGTCTSGKVGVINCLTDRNCDSSFGAYDGVCEGSQMDSDDDGVGDACSTLPPDEFERNDLPGQAGELAYPYYYELTIDNAMDTDFLKITIPYETDRFDVQTIYSTLYREMGVLITYQDCNTCPSVWASGTFRHSDHGWTYEERGQIPAGRTYLLELYETEKRGPFEYTVDANIGGEALAPDPNEPNDLISEATEIISGCDFTRLINIHDFSDVDYYKVDATGYSIKAEITFDPTQGELELFLDGIQATDTLPSGNETSKTLTITGCGSGEDTIVEVRGEANYYTYCITRIPIQEGCPGYFTPDVLSGDGVFTYINWTCGPGDLPVEQTANVKEPFYAVITSESDTEVFWTVGAAFEELGYPIIIELHAQKGAQPSPADVTIQLRNPVNTNDIMWQGSGSGFCYGPESPGVITGFEASADLTSIVPSYCFGGAPGHGTLTIQGYFDSDNDGIPDQVEMDTGTNPYSDDTDNDGLADGEEDANHNGQVDYLQDETDPRRWDTDGDGVSDGVEEGLSTPNANDTDPGEFEGDLDPSTTTDPTRTDTDGDGRSDGEEDANHNGKVDPGETSPIVPDEAAVAIEVVQDLAARSKSGKIQLTWTHLGVDSYNVYRKQEGGEYAFLANTVSTYCTYLDTSVTNGTTYHYMIKCQCNTVEGEQSNEVSATPTERTRR